MRSNIKTADLLKLSGNDWQRMEYDELANAVYTLSETARKRLARNPEGYAYEKIKKRAEGKGRNVKVEGLYIKDGKVRIHQNFIGTGRMTMSQLRALRKELTLYLSDDTSTAKGLKKWRKKQAETLKKHRDIIDLGDAYDYTEEEQADNNKWIWDIFDSLVTDEDFIKFGVEHLGWNSGEIYNLVKISGGYRNIDENKFQKELFTKAMNDLKSAYGEREKPMPNFGYDSSGTSGGVFK